MQHLRQLPGSGELIAGKYLLLRQLGAGGMGVVFEAVNRATEKHVALKFLSPELSATADAQARFEREAKATGRIHHPNVVAVHDYGEHEGRLYMVLELLKGVSLRDWMASETVTLEAACRVMFPVMRGVAAAHATGVLHRDLKPDNVFMTDMPDGMDAVPKVLDFGLAKLFSPHDKQTQLSVAGIAMGTYEFMAPEQLRARGEEDARTDVYALGAIMFSMVAGRLPYEADNPVDLALRMLESEPPLLHTLAQVPHDAAQVIARALAFQASNRFATVEEFANALEPFAGGMTFRGGGLRRASAPGPAPRAPGITEQLSVRPLATPFRASPSASPTRPRAPRWPWALVGVLSAASLAIAVWMPGEPAPGAEAPAAAPQGALPADRGVEPARPGAQLPKAAVVHKPPSATPFGAPPRGPAAHDEEGLTLIERPSPEAQQEPESWPDARPAARSTVTWAPELQEPARHGRRSSRRSRRRGELGTESSISSTAKPGDEAKSSSAPSPLEVASEPAAPVVAKPTAAPVKSRGGVALGSEDF